MTERMTWILASCFFLMLKRMAFPQTLLCADVFLVRIISLSIDRISFVSWLDVWCYNILTKRDWLLFFYLDMFILHSGGKTKQMMYVLGPSDKLTSWILILPSMGSGTYIVVYREQSFKRFWFPGTYWYICDNYGYVHLIWGKHKDKSTLLLEGPYSL